MKPSSSLILMPFAIIAAMLISSTANASWVKVSDMQHALKARCPSGFQLVSVDAGDADLLVCAPNSRRRKDRSQEQARLPKHDENAPQGKSKLN